MATLFDYFQAIRDENTALLKPTLSAGKWPIDFQNAYGQTALHIATIYNKQDIIKMLVCCNASLNLHDAQGNTPLHIAAQNASFDPQYLNVVKLLLQCGADGTIPTIAAQGPLAELPDYVAGRLPVDCAGENVREKVAELIQNTKKDDVMVSKLRMDFPDLVLPGERPPAEDSPADLDNGHSAPVEHAVPLDINSLPKDVLLFVGQGTQFVGMAKDVLESNGPGKQIFERASAILGYDLGKLCLEGPEDKLTSTAFSQPAVMVSSLAALEEYKHKNPAFMADCGHFAGFSLGEITALVAAGLVTFEDGLKLVKIRAEAMQLASEKNPGGMGSITGLDDTVLDQIVEEVKKETGAVLKVANYLFPKGRVVSGEHAAVEALCKKAEAKGAINAKKLVVGGAFHTELMALAQDEIAKALDNVTITAPKFAVYSNVTGKPYQSVQEVRDLLKTQVVSPVRWEETSQTLAALGGKIYEVGAGEQLKAMMKRVDADAWKRMQNIGHWMPSKR